MYFWDYLYYLRLADSLIFNLESWIDIFLYLILYLLSKQNIKKIKHFNYDIDKCRVTVKNKSKIEESSLFT
jgi:hypothetical protein